MTSHLYDALFAAAAPDAVAIEWAGEAVTYGQLARRAALKAAALGVEPGERIAVQVEKSLDCVVLYLAALRAGAVWLPLNPAYTLAELEFFIADAEPTLFVCESDRAADICAIARGARVAGIGALGEGPPGAPTPRGASDLAAICYTSGTTGRSKGAMLSHGALLANALALKEAWRFTTGDVLIHALPLYHVHGLFVAIHVSMLAGASMILQPRFDPAAILADLPRATALMGVPTFYTRLLAQEGLTRCAAAHMRLFVSGSAPLLARTHAAFAERTGHAILERYGLTETLIDTSNPYDGERRPGTVGHPLPGVELRLSDGQIEVRGSSLFSGYWRDPNKTAAAFTPDGWFRTGDIGEMDAEGYLTLVGRGSDLIISGGLNIYPSEVEAAIDALDGVVECAVVGLPHPDLGEAPAAIVAGEGEEAAILASLERRLARFKRPRRVLFVDALPRNAMGKVQKAALRRRYAGLFDGAA
jgi:malonyl-CoA/methylmalonyl-CoA synthetase